MTKHRAVILGCGSSGGVPRLGGVDGEGDWGECDANNPRNRRTRCSLLLERPHPVHGYRRDCVTSVLIDASPDMRAQLLGARCARIDAVLFSHEHADQTHGIDDLRAFALRGRSQVPAYIDPHTSGGLLTRFGYCFDQPEGSWYPPILEYREMPRSGERLTVDGPAGSIPITPFLQKHGAVDSLGFRIGDLAYSSDVVELPDESWQTLAGVRTWIVDALQMHGHGSHAHLAKALEWIEVVKPQRAILTNLHVSMDYDAVMGITPAHVDVAYDGMVVDFDV